jgi:hypothetical protein
LLAENDSPLWTNSSVKYSIAWPSFSSAFPACGVICRLRGRANWHAAAGCAATGTENSVVEKVPIPIILTRFFGAAGFLFRLRTYRFPIANKKVSRFVSGNEVTRITPLTFEAINGLIPTPAAATQPGLFAADEASIGSLPDLRQHFSLR